MTKVKPIHAKFAIAIVGAMAFLISNAGPATAGDPVVGKRQAATCTACHGQDGKALNPAWPNLAGQNQAYLLKQMKDMKAGKREVPMCQPFLMNFSDRYMEDMAAYFSQL